jgi:hypothetical protein
VLLEIVDITYKKRNSLLKRLQKKKETFRSVKGTFFKGGREGGRGGGEGSQESAPPPLYQL